MAKLNYNDKFSRIIPPLYEHLQMESQDELKRVAFLLHLTSSELKEFTDYALDISQWEMNFSEMIQTLLTLKATPLVKDQVIFEIREKMRAFREKRSYRTPLKISKSNNEDKRSFKSVEDKKAPIFGRCPVASEKTLCCNLVTLDAVRNCAFECSYCSIQGFGEKEALYFDQDFKTKLQGMEIKSDEIYHIGTGQSSDSLMWGNRFSLLDDLIAFAVRHPNVILEFKSKSDQISSLLNSDLPKNIITTWSLNPQNVIDSEEHLTASLEKRISAAEKIAEKGNLVGFHFHPIFYSESYQSDYNSIIKELIQRVPVKNVALVSMGALTYTTKVMKEIRMRKTATKVLQMPLEEIAGKYSYPLTLKREIFKSLYDSFGPWHNKVFFYLCMEDRTLWKPVFGYEYADNLHFEKEMKAAYLKKINEMRVEAES